jgi:hypothetical protein
VRAVSSVLVPSKTTVPVEGRTSRHWLGTLSVSGSALGSPEESIRDSARAGLQRIDSKEAWALL